MEVAVLARDDENPPERERLHALLEDLRRRGYRWGDIAVLASRNEEVIRATSWLNEEGIPFISFSSLDVRRRKPAGEILALLAFLDSPKDDLSFVTFILGDIFRAALDESPGAPSPARLHRFLLEHRDRTPLYKAFQHEFPGAWEDFFTHLFRSAGYLPLYDLASEIYAVFEVFRRRPDEEATLAKLLEAIKDFEGSGSNSLRDFLRFAADTGAGGAWDIDVPEGSDSVRAMTIHKAKGLGFPVVIVLLYGEKSRRFDATVLRSGRRDQARAAHQGPRATGFRAQRPVRRGGRHRQGQPAQRPLRGLTRAKEEMYVIGVKRDKDSFPFDLLPESGFAPAAAAAERQSRGARPGRLPPSSRTTHGRFLPPSARGG